MTAKLTPEQRRQNILDRIDTAGATLTHLWEEIDRRYVELCGKPMLTCDGVDTALVEAVRAGLDTYPHDLLTCEHETPHDPVTCVACTQDDAIHKGVRLGLIGDSRVRKWIDLRQMSPRVNDDSKSNPLRALRNKRHELAHGIRKPLPKEDVALSEAWCDLKREERAMGKSLTRSRPCGREVS